MQNGFPEKDVQVAARLIEKLANASEELSKIQAEFDDASKEHDALRNESETRGAYIDVLKEIASELGEEVDDHDPSKFDEFEIRIKELRESLDKIKSEKDRLQELADKLKTSSPDLFEFASSGISKTQSAQKKTGKTSKSQSIRADEPAEKPAAGVEIPPIERNPFELQSVFELVSLRQNAQLRRRGTIEPTIIFDAFNMTQVLNRYNTNPMFGTDYPRNRMVCDIDFLAGEVNLPCVIVFDSQFNPTEEIKNRVSISSVTGRTGPDKAASNRQILRLVEEAQVERRPAILVTNDVPLSREAAALGAINLTLQEVFTEA